MIASKTHHPGHQRVAARRGKKRAVVAVGHSILITIYRMPRNGVVYHDLGPGHFEAIARERMTGGAVNRLQRLGYKVNLEPAA